MREGGKRERGREREHPFFSELLCSRGQNLQQAMKRNGSNPIRKVRGCKCDPLCAITVLLPGHQYNVTVYGVNGERRWYALFCVNHF